MRNGVIIAGFVALAAVAAAGWARKPARAPAEDYTPMYAHSNAVPNPAYPMAQPAGFGQYTGAMPCSPAVAAQPVFYAPEPYATRPGVRVVRQPEVVREAPETRVVERRVVREVPRRQVVSRRSTGKSVAIVAGSAGAGALIGGLAGGGKGAAIGGLGGGAAGFIYDRLTHVHRE
jgi:hypothetical protein